MSHSHYAVQPSGLGIGADILGVDLKKPLEPQEVDAINDAWTEHLVLRFRAQRDLSVNQHIAFSKNFGQLDKAPIKSIDAAQGQERPHPEIAVISNIRINGKRVGSLGSSEAAWHSDMTYKDTPPKASCLYSVEIPAQGGNTYFLNMYKAYESLDDAIKKRVENLGCVHDASRNSAGELRVGYIDQLDPTKTVGAIHPLVITHPQSRKKSLFLGRRRNAYIPSLSLGESEALLDFLWAHAIESGSAWAQVWQVGDVVIWDNRCTMHRRDEFDDNVRRLMFRTQITGVAPKQ